MPGMSGVRHARAPCLADRRAFVLDNPLRRVCVRHVWRARVLPPDRVGADAYQWPLVSEFRSRVSADSGAAGFGFAGAKDRLAAADATEIAVPGPMAAVVGVHELQRADVWPVETDSHHQVRVGHRDPDYFDELTVDELDLGAGHRRLGMYGVLGHPVQQGRCPPRRQSGDDELWQVGLSEAYRVRPRRVNAIAFDALHDPAITGDLFD